MAARSIKHLRSSRKQVLRRELRIKSLVFSLMYTYRMVRKGLKQGTAKPRDTMCCPASVSQEDARLPGMTDSVGTFS